MLNKSKDWSKMTVGECREELHRMYNEAMNPPEAQRPRTPALGQLLAKAKVAKGQMQINAS